MIWRIVFLSLFFLSLDAYAADLQHASFDNGVRLIVEEDHSAPVAIIETWLEVGGRDELPGKTGLAHVFEHMMFKGSKKLGPGEFSKRIAAIGGTDNAFTATDFTAYFEIIPAESVAEVLELEAERFANLRLAKEDFVKEIEVIKEERRLRYEDDPNNRLFEELAAAALRLHPYRNPVIGWMQDLEKLGIDDVRAFFRQHYVPSKMIVVVVGDVNFDAVRKQVGRTFGKLKARDAGPRFNPVEPPPLGPKRIQVNLPAQLPMLALTMPVPVWQPGKNDREVAALAVATQILSGGRSALMQRELVDRQRLAFSTGAYYDPFAMGLDLWSVSAALGRNQDPDAFEAAFWKLVDQLAEQGPSEQQLASVKRRVIAAEVFGQDSIYLRAKKIGQLEAVGIGADRREDWLEAIRQVTAEDVRATVKSWLKPERTTVGLLVPEAT